jgi:Rrf2 family nitric oxide-sensitive transcriptional repressor
MQLNVTTDYAVRALVYLASENRMVTGVEIADKMDIPPSYLLTIMATLRNANFVTVKRGNAGGYSLAKPLNEISLWDIMVVMEGTMKIHRSLEDGDTSKNSAKFAPVRAVYQAVQSSMESYFRSATLESLVS